MVTSAIQERLIADYRKAPPEEQAILQWLAIEAEPLYKSSLIKKGTQSGILGTPDRPIEAAALAKLTKTLLAKDLLAEAYRHGPLTCNDGVVDFVYRDARKNERALQYEAKLCDEQEYGYSYYGERGAFRRLRKAFYDGDIQAWNENLGELNHVPTFIDPFCRNAFDELKVEFKAVKFRQIVDRFTAIQNPEISIDDLDFIESAMLDIASEHSMVSGALLDLYVSRGDIKSLKKLAVRASLIQLEINACVEFLIGNYEIAMEGFDTALKALRKRTRKRTAILQGFSLLLYALLLLRQNTSGAHASLTKILKKRQHRDATEDVFDHFGEMVALGMDCQNKPTAQVPHFFLRERSECQLKLLAKAWINQWFYSDNELSLDIADVEKAVQSFRQKEQNWFVAELENFIGKTQSGAAAKAIATRSEIAFQALGVQSLENFIAPKPLWEKALTAIENMFASADETANDTKNSPETEPKERMIWDVSFSEQDGWISVDPILQKLGKKGWTKGRKVSLSKLHENKERPDLSYLTEQDKTICRSLNVEVGYNPWGYRETTLHWNYASLAVALVGHPHVYRKGNRTNPIEITVATPRLCIEKKKRGVKFVVIPKKRDGEVQIETVGANRIAITQFSNKQSQLAGFVEMMPEIPSTEQKRIASISKSLSSVIEIQSDIESGGASGEAVASISDVVVQLTPYQEGLRAELFTQPLGGHGPFCRPGLGAASVFANVEGKPLSTRRDIDAEKKNFSHLLLNCHQLDSRTVDNNQTEWLFQTPLEALELMSELNQFAKTANVTILWPKGKKFDVAGKASLSQFKVAIKRDRDWFAATGDLQIDDTLKFGMMQIVEMIEESPTRFLRLTNGRFLELTQELRNRVAELSSMGTSTGAKIRFTPVRALLMDELIEDANVKTDKHWKNHIEKIQESSSLKSTPPNTIQTELRDYQREGYGWLKRLAHWNTGACLADDMGLGKTIQAMALLIDRSDHGPALVVAPASVGFNWENEIYKFAPTLVPKMFRDSDRKTFFKELGPRDVAIASYGLVQSEIKEFSKIDWTTAILDEAQAIKNMETKRSQAVMKLKADFKIVLTGTPLENHMGEMWNLFRFITPGLLGSSNEFRDQFVLPIEKDGCRQTRNRLKRLIRPFLLRRTKSEVLSELPSRTESVVEIKMSDAEIAFYDALRTKAIQKLQETSQDNSKKGETHLQILAELTKLRLACCHPALVGGESIPSSKLEMFRIKIREIMDGAHKVLVFSQFVKHLSILKAELDSMNISYQYLDGSTPTKKRKSIVESFQSGEGDVFLISLKAGGTGLNLTAADYVIHMDPWWNPAVEDQATDRAHRIGQLRPVNVYRFITKGTIEEKIVDLHQSKRDLADSLLSESNIATKLSTDDLIKLLQEN
ncbi:DEAD/DEAH box helicase [Pirellulaceae bacterium]|nr:DEAD/DEAH box helicase [Pirellulaceae bacterium]